MFPLVCSSIIDHVSASFIFEPNENGVIADDVSKTVAKYMNVAVRFPKNQWRFEASLSKLLAVPVQDFDEFYQYFTKFLTVIDEHFFKIKKCDQLDETTNESLDVPMMCCQFINCILSYIQINADAFKEIRSNATNIRIPQVFFNIIYWPLSYSLSKNDVSQLEICWNHRLFSHTMHLKHNFYLFVLISVRCVHKNIAKND